jgi:hypothetical protein
LENKFDGVFLEYYNATDYMATKSIQNNAELISNLMVVMPLTPVHILKQLVEHFK